MDAIAASTMLSQIDKLWIQPEISRRNQSGTDSKNIRILQCLVRLPLNRAPVVQFNEEIEWVASIQPAPGVTIVKDQTVYLHQIRRVISVNPPTMDGKRVAYVLLFHNGENYSILFDFSPNIPIDLQPEDSSINRQHSDLIALLLQELLVEKAIHSHDKLQPLFKKIGLWPAPSLMPYPLTKIAYDVDHNDLASAARTLLEYCTPPFIKQRMDQWWIIPAFASRRQLLEDAYFAHTDRKYTLSIHALLPQLEGIVTDFVATRLPPDKMPWRQESKTKAFRDLVFAGPPSGFAFRRIVDASIDFILSGPVLETFGSWMQKMDTSFPNRHVVEHGRHDPALYSEENSIKLFLLLDTVSHIVFSTKLNLQDGQPTSHNTGNNEAQPS